MMIPGSFKYSEDFEPPEFPKQIIDETSRFPISGENHRYVRNKILFQIRERLISEGWKITKFSIENTSNFFLLEKTECEIRIHHEPDAQKYCYLVFRNKDKFSSIGWKEFIKTPTSEILEKLK